MFHYPQLIRIPSNSHKQNISSLEDGALRIVVVRIGNRREVCR